MSILTEKIENYIEPIVTDLGHRIVRVTFIGASKTRALQVMIERLDDKPVSIEDCESVSRAVSVALDVMNPIKNKYNLEVSSAGIDRPLIKHEDFERFVGKYVVIKTFVPKEEKKIFKGLLDSVTERGIKLCLDVSSNAVIEFEYNEIKYAHLDGMRVL